MSTISNKLFASAEILMKQISDLEISKNKIEIKKPEELDNKCNEIFSESTKQKNEPIELGNIDQRIISINSEITNLKEKLNILVLKINETEDPVKKFKKLLFEKFPFLESLEDYELIFLFKGIVQHENKIHSRKINIPTNIEDLPSVYWAINSHDKSRLQKNEYLNRTTIRRNTFVFLLPSKLQYSLMRFLTFFQIRKYLL